MLFKVISFIDYVKTQESKPNQEKIKVSVDALRSWYIRELMKDYGYKSSDGDVKQWIVANNHTSIVRDLMNKHDPLTLWQQLKDAGYPIGGCGCGGSMAGLSTIWL